MGEEENDVVVSKQGTQSRQPHLTKLHSVTAIHIGLRPMCKLQQAIATTNNLQPASTHKCRAALKGWPLIDAALCPRDD